MENKNLFKKADGAAGADAKKKVKAGSYSIGITVILLAAIIVFNLFVNALPSKYTVLDTSVTGMYTISSTTESFLYTLKEDVTIYLISEGGKQ